MVSSWAHSNISSFSPPWEALVTTPPAGRDFKVWLYRPVPPSPGPTPMSSPFSNAQCPSQSLVVPEAVRVYGMDE